MLLLLCLVLGTASAAPMQAGGIPFEFCYTWEHGNSTGLDANDLHVRLKGVQQISAAYTGPGNPFGAPTLSQYVPGLDSYSLEFTGATVFAGELARTGVCTQRGAMLRLGPGATTPPVFWSDSGAALTPAPLFLGLTWRRDAGGLVVDLHNDQSAPLVIWSLNVLETPVALPLEDLDAGAAAGLNLVAVLTDDVVTLAPGATQSFAVPAAASASLAQGYALVVEAQASAEDDLGNTLHLLAQGQGTTLYLPVIRR